MCEGTCFIKGSASLAKFLEYMIEFKLGLQPSYEQKKIKNK